MGAWNSGGPVQGVVHRVAFGEAAERLLDLAYGPSVTSVSSSRTRTVVASRVGRAHCLPRARLLLRPHGRGAVLLVRGVALLVRERRPRVLVRVDQSDVLRRLLVVACTPLDERRAPFSTLRQHPLQEEPRARLVERLVEVPARALHARRAAGSAEQRWRSRAVSSTQSSNRSKPRSVIPDAARVAVVDEDRRAAGLVVDVRRARRCPSGRTSPRAGGAR